MQALQHGYVIYSHGLCSTTSICICAIVCSLLLSFIRFFHRHGGGRMIYLLSWFDRLRGYWDGDFICNPIVAFSSDDNSVSSFCPPVLTTTGTFITVLY